MKLTKKDKIMLLVLGLVIVVAVFYVYGIMPAKEQVADLDAIVAQKQSELDTINQNLSGLQTGVYEKKIEEALENYFAHKGEKTPMLGTMDRIDTEKYMVDFLKGYNAARFATTSWTTTQSTVTVEVDGVSASYDYYITNIPLSCQMKTLEDYFRFVNDLEENPHFILESTSYVVNEKQEETPPAEGEDPAPVEEFYEISCSMQLKLFTGDQYDSAILPNELPQVVAQLVDGTTDTLVFDKVENALSYEAYRISTTEGGIKEFIPVRGVSFVEKDGKMTVKFTSDNIKTENKEAEIFIRAIGNKVDYYKSIMNKNSVGINIKVA